jgi:hypothetical protein
LKLKRFLLFQLERDDAFVLKQQHFPEIDFTSMCSQITQRIGGESA